MIYITVHQRPRYQQISFEEMLYGTKEVSMRPIYTGISDTVTYERDHPSEKFLNAVDIASLTKSLVDFAEQTKPLREVPRERLYMEYEIDKRTEGKRLISEPCIDLRIAMDRLKHIFEDEFHVLYHTSAFAYIRKRSIKDVLVKHQQNESHWFAKFDFKDFFGSTTLDFVMRMFSMIFPFSEVVKTPEGKTALRDSLELCFLRNGLPQGSTISPLITNVMMIPIDFTLTRGLSDLEIHKRGRVYHQSFVYTRYADDINISSRYTFNVNEVESYIAGVLNDFGASFHIKPEKTHYGSRAGCNWMLGLKINKDNQITVGSKKKREFEAKLSAYVMDKKAGRTWDLSEVQYMEGLRSYYSMVEGNTIDRIISHLSKKFGVDIPAMIKSDLSV